MAIELRPRFLWLDHQLAEGYAVRIGSDGRIRHVAPTNQPPQHDLEDAAIFPGFVNAHSHAFQWGLRGWVQRSSGVGGFFSWRDRMYELVEQLDAHQIYRESRLAYKAMRRAGYTSVGEFHYVHHQPDARPYPNDIELAEAVVQAARDENIRLRLLHAAYFRNSGSEPDASPAQLRFCDSSAEAFLARHKRLGKRLEAMGDPRVGLGTALHSTRAVPLAEMATIARATYGPLHVHINEQPREIDDAIQEYELRPFDVLEQAGALGRRTTLVHMTHATVSELERTAAHQAQICFCPTTERDLGDGIGPSRAGLARGIYMSIGSDSHAQIDPLAECRLLEAHERLIVPDLEGSYVSPGARVETDRLHQAPVLKESDLSASREAQRHRFAGRGGGQGHPSDAPSRLDPSPCREETVARGRARREGTPGRRT